MHKLAFKNGFILLCLVSAMLSACRKNKEEITPPVTTTPTTPIDSPTTTISDVVLKDSILYYSRDIYLWSNNIPTDFKAQSFSDPEALMAGIRPYSIESGFSAAVDRWSFAMKQEEWDKLSSGLNLLQDNASEQGDFGMTVFFLREGDLRVRLVEPNSPAGRAGIHRGWRITKINGSSNITTGNSSFLVNTIYESTSTAFTFTKPDGSTETISLNAAHYTEQPVYLDSVYTIGSNRIGYLVFNSFLGEEAKTNSELQRVFTSFESKGVTDVVIDVRYNGGGYVSIQQKLANYLINNAGNGGVMMKQQYNSANSRYNSTTYFRKTGSLNLNRIYFIIGSSTASASELLINNLKPYMDVRLVGPTRTHGKPVGYFPIPVGKEWYIFPVSFRSVNKNNEGSYFNGIPVTSQVADGLDKDWGDASEDCFASVIRNITTGRYSSQTLSSQRVMTQDVLDGNKALDEHFLKVTIDNKGF